MESVLSMDGLFRGQVKAAEPLKGGAAFRWESTTAGVLILAALGYPTSAPSAPRHLENLAHLSMLAGSEAIVGYRGCDSQSHFFALPNQQPCAIPLHHWNVTFLPVNLGLCLPLYFEAGKLTVPPRDWAMRLDLATLQWAID